MKKRYIAIVLVALACQTPQQQADTSGASTTAPVPGGAASPDTSGAGSGSGRADTAQVDSTGATLTVDRTSYRAGGQVQMNIVSRSRDTLGFNPCNRIIERQSGQQWGAYPEPNRMCTMELWLLEPGATRTAQTEIPAGMPAGTYRMMLLLSPQTSRQARPVRATSASFRVQ